MTSGMEARRPRHHPCAAVAAREGNMTFPDCIHLMPLSALCALYVNYRRRKGADGAEIARRLPDTVLDEIDRRIDALAEEFLKRDH